MLQWKTEKKVVDQEVKQNSIRKESKRFLINTINKSVEYNKTGIKQCVKCLCNKSLSDFYVLKHGKYKNMNMRYGCCIECIKKQRKSFALAARNNQEWLESYNKRQRKNYYARMEFDREKYRAKGREYYKRKKRTKSYPLKSSSRQKLNNAVSCGKIKKPSKCSVCHMPSKRIEGHHEDYKKPFEVIWLCSVCHGKKHRRYVNG